MHCTAINCPFKNYPSSYNIDCIPLNELELLFPVDEDKLPNVETVDQIHLNFAFEGSAQKASINARTNVLPSSPLSLLDNEEFENIEEAEFCKGVHTNDTCNDNLNLNINPECVCTHVRQLRYDQSIQMVFSAVSPNYDVSKPPIFDKSHPIHLHGHQFHVVDIQYGEYDEEGRLIRANDSITCGGSNVCTNPGWAEGKDYSNGQTGKISNKAPRKDTIILPAGGYVVVYFISNNPGFWFLHCHIEIHQIQGMAMIISEARDHQLPAPAGMDTCGNFTWTLDEFYEYLSDEPPTQASSTTTPSSTPSDNNDVLADLSIGLGVILAVSLAVNVIIFVVCCFLRRK